MGVLAWLSFLVTGVLAGLHVWRTRRGEEGVGMGEMHGGWVGRGAGAGAGAGGKV